MTCGWDPVARRTLEQRSKEEAHDYRYFPDPDLPPVRIDPAWVEQQERERPEPLDAFRRRLSEQGVPGPDVRTILAAGAAPFLYAACATYPNGAVPLAKWLLRAVFPLVNEDKVEVEESKLAPAEFAAAVRMKDEGRLNDEGVRTVVAALFREGGAAAAVAEARSLFQVTDGAAIARAIDESFVERPELVSDIRGGKAKARNALFGHVMKKMAGRADPGEVNAALTRRLNG